MNVIKTVVSFVVLFSIISAQSNLLNIPPRPADAVEGSVFMESVKNLTFAQRESKIQDELLKGNIPNFMRNLIEIEVTYNDLNSNSHQVKYWVMPDYLCIGSDSNFCRVPMGPLTAQTAADAFGAAMPTRKLVDNIYFNATIKLEPVTYTPVGNQNELVEKFILHNTAIQNQFENANGELGELIGGTKKDVVISNKIVDPNRPGHVCIYGWHQLNGSPIQPLTNIHIDTYVDYSHGVRFIASKILIDGDTTTVQEVLKDNILYKILSDESGPMYQPSYFIDPELPTKPRSFGLKTESNGNLKIIVNPDSNIDEIHVYKSKNGINFDSIDTFTGNEFSFENLNPDSIIYIRLTAENSAGISQPSEVLSAVPSLQNQKILIVNSFDRTSDGNTYNFVIQHGSAINKSNYSFESCTNEALTDRIFKLADYSAVDFILGDESTADEAFSYPEQILVADYLHKGGRIFVSGSEIAWDLDFKGSSTDKYFIENYLKAKYAADAPGNVASTYYSAKGNDNNFLNELTDINFDNGTHGTFDVDYADALTPAEGAEVLVNYKNVSSYDIGGISYEGNMGTGTIPGKVVYLGFPFETIYPEETRNVIMEKVLEFLTSDPTYVLSDNSNMPINYSLAQNYPNPFNPETLIEYSIKYNENVQLKIYDVLGKEVIKLVNEAQSPGTYKVRFNAANLPSGIYFYTLQTDNYFKSKKMTLLK